MVSVTEKPKNNQHPYRKIKVYGCGLLLLMALVLGGLLLTLGKDFLAGQALLGSDWTNCQPQSHYAFTFSGEVFTIQPQYQRISGATVEIVSAELKRILESGTDPSFCNSNYLQPIQATSDPDGRFVFTNVRFAPWDDLSLIVHADGYLPYEETFYKGSANELPGLQIGALLEPVPTSTP
jgi:hypothetical protein